MKKKEPPSSCIDSKIQSGPQDAVYSQVQSRQLLVQSNVARCHFRSFWLKQANCIIIRKKNEECLLSISKLSFRLHCKHTKNKSTTMYISTSWWVNGPTPNFTFKKKFRMKTSPNHSLATMISTSAVSVPIKLLARHVHIPESSGRADSRIKLLPMTALPLFFFTQIISGFGVPWAKHCSCIISPFVAGSGCFGLVVMLGLAKIRFENWKATQISFNSLQRKLTILYFIIQILKWLFITAVWLALSNVIYSRIKLFFALNHICSNSHNSCTNHINLI